MYVKDLEVHEPNTLEQATTLMTRHGPGARLLAGGTDLLVDLKTGRVRAGHAISLHGIEELHGVSDTGATLRIGALTTIDELLRSLDPDGPYAILRDAASGMAAPQVRNAATVGGNIAGAVPCADLPPALMVLGASVLLWSPAGTRDVAIENVFVGPRETILKTGEVLEAVHVPRPPNRFGAAYARFSLRGGNAIAVAGVAAGLELTPENVVRRARIALAAVAPTPMLAVAAGDELIDRPLDEQAIAQAAEAAMAAAKPISDLRGSAGYRRDLVGVLTQRALAAAHRRTGG